MKKSLLALMLLSLPVAAQEAKDDRPKNVQKLFILKYAETRNVRDLLAVFQVPLFPNDSMHTIAVTAPPETMRAIEEAIARLDTPAAAPKDIDFVVQLVLASDSVAVSNPLPKDLDPVVAQLRNAFPFKNYGLLDILTLRTRTGQSVSMDSAGGAIQVAGTSKTVFTNFAIGSSSIAPDGTTIRVDRIRYQSRIPGEPGSGDHNVSITTDADIKDGQKVVIGRNGINREQAVFLVLSARVVQ